MTRPVRRPGLLLAAAVGMASLLGAVVVPAAQATPTSSASAAVSPSAVVPGVSGPSIVTAQFDADVLVVGARNFPPGASAHVSATAGPYSGEGTLKIGSDGRLLFGFQVPPEYSGPITVTVTAGTASATATVTFPTSVPTAPVTPATPAPSGTQFPAPESAAPAAPDGPQLGGAGRWNLLFDDEFSGTTLDETKWQLCNPSFRAYCLPWNNELQIFNTAPTNNANVNVTGGQLHLVATKDAGGQIYSGMVSTGPWLDTFGPAPAGYHPFTYTYGYYEGRVRIPRGNGFWPSMWQLPQSANSGTGWPGTGEFDVFEIPGNDPTEYHFTAHWGGDGGACGHPCSPQQATISDASVNWHTFGLDWQPDGLTWYVDGQKMGDTITDPGALKNTPFFIIMNFSVGGSWGPLRGGLDASTQFPASMDIDWVRVYQRA